MDPSPSAAVKDLFKRRFGSVPAHIVRAPAALELLGCSGALPDSLCLCAALDRCIYMAASPRTDGRIELLSSTFPQAERFSVDAPEKNPAAPWAHFPKSVLAEFRRRNVHYSGFDAAILDEIPAGCGLGRFAALQVATALTLRKLWPFSLAAHGLAAPPNRGSRGELPAPDTAEKVVLARLCADAQEHFLGLESSAADALACLFGRSWHVLGIDLRFATVDPIPLVGCVWVICRLPNVARSKSLSRESCLTAARRLGVKSLRSLETRDLAGTRRKLPEPEYGAVAHVVGEMARVVAAERALQNDDAVQFGALLLQSGESALVPEPAPTELRAVLELTRNCRACLGARIIGQSVLCLVPHHQAAGFVNSLKQGRPDLDLVVAQPTDGAA